MRAMRIIVAIEAAALVFAVGLVLSGERHRSFPASVAVTTPAAARHTRSRPGLGGFRPHRIDDDDGGRREQGPSGRSDRRARAPSPLALRACRRAALGARAA